MRKSITDRWTEIKLRHWLIESLREALAELTRPSDAAAEAGRRLEWTPRATQPGLWERWEQPQWFRLDGDWDQEFSLSIGAPAETLQSLWERTPDDPAPSEEGMQKAFQQKWNQVSGKLANDINQKLGKSGQFREIEPSNFPQEPELGIEFTCEIGESKPVLAFVPNEALVNALLTAAKDATDSSGLVERQSSPPASNEKQSHPTRATGPPDETAKNNLALLMEVDLDLSVSFGQTVLPLQEVLKLSSGSIVELNRSAADPVEVRVNNSVIARGEVVVVDGNYGVRITEVVSQKDRIHSIL